MKTSKLTKLLAVLLALTFVFSSVGMTTASAASGGATTYDSHLDEGGLTAGFQRVISDFFETIVNFVLKWFNGLFPNGPGFVDEADAPDHTENFYTGTGDFQTATPAGNQWYLGYANASLVPADWETHTYYIGGFIDPNNGFTNNVERIADDMKVRTIAMKDSATGKPVIFATIDCIGITNGDIRVIRKAFTDLVGTTDFAAINVSSTHCHSCIDTEGLWTNNLVKIIGNAANSGTGTGEELKQGTDPVFMDFLYKTVSKAMKAAYENMTAGTLTYATKDIGADYFNNKNRGSSDALMTDLNRFVFTPDVQDDAHRPTMILNLAAHPDVAGLPTSEINNGRIVSGDYVYYCGELLDQNNYNFMFFNGAIAGIYMGRGVTGDGVPTTYRYEESKRFGYEIARMAIGMTMTEQEIAADVRINVADEIAQYGENVNDQGLKTYSIWYEGWTPVTAVTVDPILNLALRQVEVEISNDLMGAAGKLNLANYDVVAHEDGSYTIFTEVGYMEWGKQFQTVLMPGEIVQDLIVGGSSLTAEGSQTKKEFGYPTAREIFGDTTMCFGLTNDAIGYVVPDNDFSSAIIYDHYQETISLGRHTASALITALQQLETEIHATPIL